MHTYMEKFEILMCMKQERINELRKWANSCLQGSWTKSVPGGIMEYIDRLASKRAAYPPRRSAPLSRCCPCLIGGLVAVHGAPPSSGSLRWMSQQTMHPYHALLMEWTLIKASISCRHVTMQKGALWVVPEHSIIPLSFPWFLNTLFDWWGCVPACKDQCFHGQNTTSDWGRSCMHA
jgi:hypothetical protein